MLWFTNKQSGQTIKQLRITSDYKKVMSKMPGIQVVELVIRLIMLFELSYLVYIFATF